MRKPVAFFSEGVRLVMPTSASAFFRKEASDETSIPHDQDR